MVTALSDSDKQEVYKKGVELLEEQNSNESADCLPTVLISGRRYVRVCGVFEVCLVQMWIEWSLRQSWIIVTLGGSPYSTQSSLLMDSLTSELPLIWPWYQTISRYTLLSSLQSLLSE